MALALRWMQQNQQACFDIPGTRARIAERLG
jgi:hypothetical protein